MPLTPSGYPVSTCQQLEYCVPQGVCLYPVIRRIVGLILLGAAIAKCVSGYEDVASQASTFQGALGLVEPVAEAVFGLWLLGSRLPRLSWLAAVLLFSIFLGISVFNVVTNGPSCRCFGAYSPPPVKMLLLNLAVLTALILWHPDYRGALFCRHSIVAIILLGLPSVAALASGHWSPLSHPLEARSVSPRAVRVLKPREWLGKRFGLFESLSTEFAVAHSSGTTVLLFHRLDCAACVVELKQLQQLEREHDVRAAVIRVSPSGVGQRSMGGLSVDNLPGNVEWVVQTPLVVFLKDGIVVQVASSVESLTELVSHAEN